MFSLFKKCRFNLNTFTKTITQYTPATHILFDLDGLLIDTESMNVQIIKEITSKYGKILDENTIGTKIIGRTEKTAAEMIVEKLKIPISVEEFRDIRKKMEKERLPESIKLLPGVENIVFYFKDNNLPMAIATNSRKESAEFKLSYIKHIKELMSHIVSGANDPEVKNPKPAPDIYLVAASRFCEKPKPKNCLVFEDSPTGVTAGIKAGMQVAMVPSPMLPNELTKEATVVFKSLCEFKPELFCLPPFLH